MEMKLKNCPVCGKVYVDTGIRMCRDCYEKMLDEENSILSYVRDHPKSQIKEICDATGAKERVVMKMIKDGRFIQSGALISYPCETCGKPITRGRFCEECGKKLQNEVRKQQAKFVAAAPKKKRGPADNMDPDIDL